MVSSSTASSSGGGLGVRSHRMEPMGHHNSSSSASPSGGGGTRTTSAAGSSSVVTAHGGSTSGGFFGSLKRSLGRRNRCQCKHHQQRALQRQEMARQELKRQLAERGDQRHLVAINRHMTAGGPLHRRPHTRLCTRLLQAISCSTPL